MIRTTIHFLVSNLYKKIAFTLPCIFFYIYILSPSLGYAADNERYKAIPIANGGYVFIIDTREGHTWIWNSAGSGKVTASGSNPRIEYQGNVRKNMTQSSKSSATSVVPSQVERF